MEIVTNHRDRAVAERLPDWSELMSRVVADLSRILHTEIRLLELNLRTAVANEVSRVVKAMIALVMLSLGGICAIAAGILLLHRVLGLWWLAFAIVAGAGLIVGAAILMLNRSSTSS